MATWQEFELAAPAMAEIGRRLLDGHERTAHFATVRASGAPQIHPVMVYEWDGRLWTFIVQFTSKFQDLERDGRFAFHAMPGGDAHEEFQVAGRARRVDDPAVRTLVAASAGIEKQEWEVLFELEIESVLVSRWENWGRPDIQPHFWRWSPRNGITER